ncbi:MAG: hypothetical protein PVI23_04405 [Maricaulaceae bacterium]|jgi:hypothetical protein
MAQTLAVTQRRAPQGARKVKTLIPAEDAAMALLQLQRRIVELERENAFLRGCIPAAAAVAPQALLGA